MGRYAAQPAGPPPSGILLSLIEGGHWRCARERRISVNVVRVVCVAERAAVEREGRGRRGKRAYLRSLKMVCMSERRSDVAQHCI
jgi:hypothetical protein